MAAKARRLAHDISDEPTNTALNAYANECDAKAAAADIKDAEAAEKAQSPMPSRLD